MEFNVDKLEAAMLARYGATETNTLQRKWAAYAAKIAGKNPEDFEEFCVQPNSAQAVAAILVA